MVKPVEAFDDMPGTLLVNGERLRQGYQIDINLLLLLEGANLKAFKTDQAGYLQGFCVSDEQQEAVLKRAWSRTVELGANFSQS